MRHRSREFRLATETEWFLQTHFRENSAFSSLLTDQRSWLNGSLADYYGLNNHGLSDFAELDLSGDDRYGGLLSQGALMTVHALPTSSSPIHRGVLVREKFLCQELPPPPAMFTNHGARLSEVTLGGLTFNADFDSGNAVRICQRSEAECSSKRFGKCWKPQAVPSVTEVQSLVGLVESR